jgi:hypothetical protein
LDTRCDEITDTKIDDRARFFGAFTMDSMAFFSEEAKDSFGKLGSRRRKAKKSMDIRRLIRSCGRGGAQTQVERKSERSTDSRDTADNISTINGAAVPSIQAAVCPALTKPRVSATIVGSNSNSLIEESVEVFNSDSFVIAESSDMKVNGKSSADSLEESFKSAVPSSTTTKPQNPTFTRTSWTKRRARS